MAPLVRVAVLLFALCAMALAAAASLSARSARDRLGGEPVTPVESRTPGPAERVAPPVAPARTRSARASAGSPARTSTRRAAVRPNREANAEPRPLLARVVAGRSVVVRAWPGGRSLGRLGSRTEFGSRQVLAAITSRGRWLGVASSARTDGRLGWVDRRHPAIRLAAAPVTITADLSRRRLELRRDDRILEAARVAVGRPGSPTPTGRFAVTDKLDGARFSPYYGCCILALSGTQPNPPPGWTGGNRLAIHGTNSPGSIGTASSAGCLRASDLELRRLMRRVPLGTPVEIRR